METISLETIYEKLLEHDKKFDEMNKKFDEMNKKFDDNDERNTSCLAAIAMNILEIKEDIKIMGKQERNPLYTTDGP